MTRQLDTEVGGGIGSSIYSFPKDLLENEETKHYILFEIYDDDTATVNATKRSIARGGTNAEQWTNQVRNERDYGRPPTTTAGNLVQEYSGRVTENIEYASPKLIAEDISKNLTTVLNNTGSTTRFSRANTRSLDSIVLPLPQTLNLSDGWEWEMVGFKKNIVGNLASSIFSGSWEGFAQGSSDSLTQAMNSAMGKVAQTTMENADRLFGAQSRIVSNPRKEMLFNEPTNRTISFEYDFVPRNDFEAKSIKDITDLFKFYASPDRKNDANIIYKYPAEFQIYFISNDQENPFISKLARVVLTSIETNYMGAGVASMLKNNSPSRIKVTMSFSETELLDRRHYFAEKDVSPVTQEGA